jgi:ubiquinone/menaquinone biosynthesis C-methylase UbiE
MQVMSSETKFAHLGKPGDAFSKGFARRLAMIVEHVDLKDKKILDVGCGKGVWLNQFANFTAPENVYGTDIDPELISDIPETVSKKENLQVSPAEQLPFADNTFDVVFSNEVLEHVVDDKQAVSEAIRVLKPGGKFIIFTPNRGWPFEQHGMFLGGKYFWGNIPLLPWLPKWFQHKFAHHVRNYWDRDIRNLLADQPVKVLLHTHIFPGFDGWVRRLGGLGKFVRDTMHALEKTPLQWFGISHFVIVEKLSQ